MIEARLVAEPWPYQLVGQRIRVDVGSLAGTEGIVLKAKNGERLIVSIPLLQRSVSVELSPEWVSVSASPVGSVG